MCEHLAETLDIGILGLHDWRRFVLLRPEYPDEHLTELTKLLLGNLVRLGFMTRPRGSETQVVPCTGNGRVRCRGGRS